MNGNQKGIKTRFNIIDFIIVIVILGCLAGVAIRYNIADKIGSDIKQDNVEISFIVQDVRNSSVAAFVEGDSFFWTQNGAYIGTLKSKDSYEAEDYVAGDDGRPIAVYSGERSDVRGVLSATGVIGADGSFMFSGNQYVAPGKEMKVKSQHIEVNLVILDIKPVE